MLALELARADVPGRAVSAASFGQADEEVHARLHIELLPPQVPPLHRSSPNSYVCMCRHERMHAWHEDEGHKYLPGAPYGPDLG